MWADLRFALRSLRKGPGFAAAAIAMLALGAGANTAILSAVDEVLLRPLPVPNASQLASVYRYNQKTSKYLSTSYPGFEDLSRRARSFESLSAYVRLQFNLDRGGHAERIPVEAVSGNYFAMLGIAPLVGSALRPGDSGSVVLGEDLWRSQYHADPGLVGRSIYLEDHPFIVAGILPRAFHGPNLNWGDPPEIWMPIDATPALLPAFRTIDILHQPRADWLLVIGRLRRGVSLSAASAELRTLQTDPDIAFKAFPTSNAKFWPAYRGSISTWMSIFASAAGLLLLLACANLSNLLLERGLARRREFAIRLALGASRGRIVRQLLTENLLLAIPGFLASLAVAHGLQRLLLGFPNAFGISLAMELTIESRALIFCFTLSICAAALFGLGPAMAAARSDLMPAMKQPVWLRQSFVVAQVAFSMILLAGGGLFGRSLLHAYSQDLGFRSDHLVAMSVSLPGGPVDPQFYDRAAQTIAEVRGVASVSYSSELPLSPVHVTGQVSDRPVNFNMVGPGYLRAAGIPLVSGRDLEVRDGASPDKVAVVNLALARQLGIGGTVLGRMIDFQERPGKTTRVQIVGVAGDSRYESVWESGEPYLYLSAVQWKWPASNILVRTAPAPAGVVPAILRAWDASVPRVPLYDLQTGNEMVAKALAPQRLAAMLLGAFAAVAILVAAVGLYSVMAFSVKQRTREIAIRLAVGARPSVVLEGVLAHAFRMAVGGVLVGGVVCLAVMRMIASQLHGISPGDPVTLTVAAVVLTGLSGVAALVPAVRAARVNPIEAIKSE